MQQSWEDLILYPRQSIVPDLTWLKGFQQDDQADIT